MTNFNQKRIYALGKECMFYTESSTSVHGYNPDQTAEVREFRDKSRDHTRSQRVL